MRGKNIPRYCVDGCGMWLEKPNPQRAWRCTRCTTKRGNARRPMWQLQRRVLIDLCREHGLLGELKRRVDVREKIWKLDKIARDKGNAIQSDKGVVESVREEESGRAVNTPGSTGTR